MREGSWDLLDADPGVLAYERCHREDRRRVVANFGDEEAATGWRGEGTVELATDAAGERTDWNGRIGPASAVVLRPAGERSPEPYGWG